ncbi:hypothetical protein HON86_03680 [Candidatus Woesearchaeota archaeon]|jgi:transposase-like protein|nr:hypothetical protein [Candidatus Woesearchaeota archaeon]MBT4835684.1 hypothetical protein [Candidatus Woesearchaeota archaeon]MBT6735306.1 hypothetical protein [Candidatus Woesearchaeota archaeon]MBT7169478.1 hypothetical protein [Candidatus Woesearchaeota archaeon]MBT7474688.1 hypothetical protein [Candidatus Woesearchaeota archaeon]
MAEMIRICPKCQSTNVSPDIGTEAYGSGKIFNSYKCNNCGFSGEFFPEVDKKIIEKIKK